MKKSTHRLVTTVAAAATVALALTACGAGRTNTSATGGSTAAAGSTLLVGTTDKVTAIDPAGSYDNGSFNIETQVFPFLMSFKPGGAELAPDAAQSCKYTSDTVYTCVLRDGLTFANGDPITVPSFGFQVRFSVSQLEAAPTGTFE